MSKEEVLEGEVESSNEKTKAKSEGEIKSEEMTKELNEVLAKYKEWCVLIPVNAINSEGEVEPAIKIKRLK